MTDETPEKPEETVADEEIAETKPSKPKKTDAEKFEAQLTHLAAGVPGQNINQEGESKGEYAVVIIDLPADKKKEDIATHLDENVAKTTSVWSVKTKRGPMKDHPFSFVNFETEEGRDLVLEVTEMFDTEVKVIKRLPSLWVGGFAEDDDDETIQNKIETAGVLDATMTRPEGKKWCYLAFKDSESALSAADTLKDAENPGNEKGFHVSFPRTGKEKMALRHKIAKSDDMDANKRKVFCYKLDEEQDEAFLKEYFSEFGDIEEIFRKEKKKFGFIVFKNYLDAYNAANSTPEGGWECNISSPDYKKKAQNRWNGGGGWGGRGGGGGARGGWGPGPNGGWARSGGYGGRRGRRRW